DLEVQIRRQTPSGPTTEHRHIKALGGQAVFRLENVSSAFEYRARGGDDDTMAWSELVLVEPPRVLELQIVVQPPTYAGLASRAESQVFSALIGSKLEIRGKVDRPIRGARLKPASTSAAPHVV